MYSNFSRQCISRVFNCISHRLVVVFLNNSFFSRCLYHSGIELPIISSSELGRTRKVFAAFGLLSSQGPARARLELEPGGPALAGPGPLHHHASAVRQRLRPADVLHGLQHLRKQVVEIWSVPMLLSWAALSEHGGPQSRRIWVSVPCSSVLSSPPPFATCSTA